ncbi:hypothetical protein IFT37_03765 [Pseudomonas fluorescens]|uniref:Uncharacterized protein n=1 Tax=Pseudomonas fluorescens TaxID=294 RepID=A0AAE2Q1V7_PSEFL|nr:MULTISPECIES: hypothetical protein [Pseudomonas fluorescens group]MBA1427662.1 hypothetical protein [Pseudomonas orientalis]MBD8147293.1 hypothetical protein [Pseudomonas fluorescens]MBD8175765.1 hypothetical protein [Pseudomonas fluorescens]MBD8272552.1 hypothetical protein [Pseudomonas fluorescens]MBD8744220.1 hypothetical protein [Pseudomonas fluorescens]
MSKTWKVNVVKSGKKSRSLDYEPNIGDEIHSKIDDQVALDQVERKIFDEVNNQIAIYLKTSEKPYP